ncbi:MAG: toluene tolerance protein [Syntrophobacteraceae bacterium CG07_land_8_20_14_0_80_61_8]|nr:MAG: toluene tolerance protein [Syntrophobacteraceae bacterium CG07_land_8_20_14_0_80_61_8]
MKRTITTGLLLALVGLAALAWAAGPLATVQARVREVLAVLNDPALQGEDAKPARRDRLRQIAGRMFDFDALARFTLGNNWRKLDRAQQQEFIQLYRQLLERAYLDKILAYTNERIVFEKEIPAAADRAEVQSTVVTATARIPIHYRLLAAGDTWLVYDVVIEGVSLVRNYRSQFNGILATQSPARMLQEMRQKLI